MGGKGSRQARKRAHEAWLAKRKAEGWTQKTVWVPPNKRVVVVDDAEDAQARIEALERELAQMKIWQASVKKWGSGQRVFKRWPTMIFLNRGENK